MAILKRAYALSNNALVSFNPATPAVGTSTPVTGLVAGQILVGIDFRPANGLLYGLGVNAATDTATLYSISVLTGAATIVGTLGSVGDLPASGYGFDFNQVTDRIRVTTDAAGLNFRIDPNNGSVFVDVAIGGSAISGVAYTWNNDNVTTLYTLDSSGDRLMIQNPPNAGTQNVVGPVGVNFSTANGFDIAPGFGTSSGSALALLTVGVGGTIQLYSINLATGAGTLIGNYLDGSTPASGLAILNTPDGADFNGNGRSDFVWQHDSGQAAVWLMNGTILMSGAAVGPNPGPSWHLQGVGDFNVDGRSDFLWQDDSGQAAVWLINGMNVIGGGPVGPNPGPSWHVIDSGDFNGDGNSDILWQNDSGQAAIWLMKGTNLVGGGAAGPNPGPSWHVIDSGDFNGDGNSDILWQNDNGQAAIWLMNGTNLIGGGAVGPNPGAGWHVKASGDFNGDHWSDILWQNDNGQAAVWLMSGTSLLTGAAVGPNPGPSWHVQGTGDFIGDGRSGIVWQNDSGQAAVWLMNGTTLLSGVGVGGSPGADWDLIA